MLVGSKPGPSMVSGLFECRAAALEDAVVVLMGEDLVG